MGKSYLEQRDEFRKTLSDMDKYGASYNEARQIMLIEKKYSNLNQKIAQNRNKDRNERDYLRTENEEAKAKKLF